MSVENLYHEMTMSEEQKGGHGPQPNTGLSPDQQRKFDALVNYVGELEREINERIADFEQKHQVSCWISNEKHNRISIAVAADKDNL